MTRGVGGGGWWVGGRVVVVGVGGWREVKGTRQEPTHHGKGRVLMLAVYVYVCNSGWLVIIV